MTCRDIRIIFIDRLNAKFDKCCIIHTLIATVSLFLHQGPQGVGYLNDCSSDTEAGSLAIESYGNEVDNAAHYLPLKEDPPGTPDPSEVASMFFKHQEFAAAQGS